MVKFDRKYWQARYENQQIGWDIGYASTPIKTYIDQIEDKKLAVLIPGAGNAYEAAYFAEHGFDNVTVLDISEAAIAAAESRIGDKVSYDCIDFFDHEGTYDLIIEQTFFCALDPELRPAYVDQMAQLLKEEGKLVGLLWDAPMNADHPPFGGDQEEYEALFKEKFHIKIMKMAYNSIPPRKGREVFVKFGKK
ncbi:MAG: methyltransferase domain-containing protein [Cyclobacteriaceae bacterium]